MTATVADVLVLRGVKTCYRYRIPEGLRAVLSDGDHVDIPLGNSVASGILIRKTADDGNADLKEIIGPSGLAPAVNAEMRQLILWMADYYQITPYSAYQCVVGATKLRKLAEKETVAEKLLADYALNSEQRGAVEAIARGEGFRRFLLYGVTASGKTEVYMQVARSMMNQKKTVLILVPEISLTPQLVKTFSDRFGKNIAVLHSALSPKQRSIEWSRICAKEADIVIGPRSAIFAPLENIGLIVIDEEHENTYKQESNPRYFTHSIAAQRAAFHGAALIFGSATPSVETFSQCESSMRLLELKKRAKNQPMPSVSIVDMREEFSAGQSLLSTPLTQAIEKRLEKKEKTILFINRRGYAPHIACQKCGEVFACPQCRLSFTYHHDRTYRCHRCDVTMALTHTCPKCKKPSLAFSGVGIQKVEAEIQSRFPGARVFRLDRDAISAKRSSDDILSDFAKHGDILLGTQLIAKGHHIEDVTLVGVLGIDTVLNIPDFRSPERAFQLITQVAGRSGRGEKPGEVFIQTFQSAHYAIVHAANQDFDAFFDQEIAYRKALWYPPFSQLINVILSSKNESAIRAYAKRAGEFLSSAFGQFGDQAQLIGPKPAPIEKLRDYFRWNILIKFSPELEKPLKNILRELENPGRGVRVIVDIDPKSVL